jgi:hypothetical protein
MDSKCPFFYWLSFLCFTSQRLLIFRLIEMFSNKETVSCFYCEWTGRKDKLGSHSNAHHPRSKVFNRLRKEKVEKFLCRMKSNEQHKILPCFFPCILFQIKLICEQNNNKKLYFQTYIFVFVASFVSNSICHD